jgi:type I restriction enzyme, S subunit
LRLLFPKIAVVRQNWAISEIPGGEEMAGVLSFQEYYEAAIVSPAYDIWNVRDNSLVYRRYLERFLRSPRALRFYTSKLRGTTARRRTLPDDIFLSLPVFLPSMEEQRRIAAILDQAEALRAKRRQALAKLDALTQSLFLEMFNTSLSDIKTKTVTLCELVKSGDTINYGVVQPGGDFPSGKPLIRVGDFSSGEIDLSEIKLIDPVIESSYKRSRLRGDEILLSCVGSIGMVALCTPETSGMNIARAVARVPADSSKINRIYLLYYLRTRPIQDYFVAQLRTVNQPTLNIKQIGETPVRIPDTSLQESFATAIHNAIDLKKLTQGALIRADLMISSLQHRAFRGEL